MGDAGLGARPATDRIDDGLGGHVVEFYEGEDFLIGSVAGFVGPSLNSGDAAIVVATEDHRCALEAVLRASRVDVAGAVATGRYLTADAERLLESFMAGGAPDPERLRRAAVDLVGRAAAGGRQVRIYGEMVTLLWNAGNVTAALALEQLWNGLAEELGVMVLCAYPVSAFSTGRGAGSAGFERICAGHSTVIPSETYALLGGEASRRGSVARLGQAVARSEADRARGRAERIAAEMAEVEPQWDAPGARARAAAAILSALELPAPAARPA